MNSPAILPPSSLFEATVVNSVPPSLLRSIAITGILAALAASTAGTIADESTGLIKSTSTPC